MGFVTNTPFILCVCIFFIASLQYITWQEQQIQPLSQVDKHAHGGDGGRDLQNMKNNSNKFLHVTSPFKKQNCVEPFCPFDQTRSIVIASMIRAKKKARVPVTLAAAVFPEDRDAIPPEFMLLPSLKRDAKTEYPGVLGMRKLPFLQEILDLALNSPTPYEYFIFTNSDIVLHEEFYNIVQEQIEKGYDAFSINRHVINTERMKNGSMSPYTALDLDEIYMRRGTNHKGLDCFIMKKEIVSQIKMGDVFLGVPPVARAFSVQMDHAATKKKHFYTHELKATYHLGTQGGWSVKNNAEVIITRQNMLNAKCLMQHFMNDCTVSKNPYCGELIKELSQHISFNDHENYCKKMVQFKINSI